MKPEYTEAAAELKQAGVSLPFLPHPPPHLKPECLN